MAGFDPAKFKIFLEERGENYDVVNQDKDEKRKWLDEFEMRGALQQLQQGQVALQQGLVALQQSQLAISARLYNYRNELVVSMIDSECSPTRKRSECSPPALEMSDPQLIRTYIAKPLPLLLPIPDLPAASSPFARAISIIASQRSQIVIQAHLQAVVYRAFSSTLRRSISYDIRDTHLSRVIGGYKPHICFSAEKNYHAEAVLALIVELKLDPITMADKLQLVKYLLKTLDLVPNRLFVRGLLMSPARMIFFEARKESSLAEAPITVSQSEEYSVDIANAGWRVLGGLLRNSSEESGVVPPQLVAMGKLLLPVRYLLGQGATGSVYASDGDLVIKQFKSQHYFQNELANLTAAARVASTGYVTSLVGEGVMNDCHCVILRPRGIGFPKATELLPLHFACIVRALQLLHSVNLVHCDVKPENLFVVLRLHLAQSLQEVDEPDAAVDAPAPSEDGSAGVSMEDLPPAAKKFKFQGAAAAFAADPGQEAIIRLENERHVIEHGGHPRAFINDFSHAVLNGAATHVWGAQRFTPRAIRDILTSSKERFVPQPAHDLEERVEMRGLELTAVYRAWDKCEDSAFPDGFIRRILAAARSADYDALLRIFV